jgi:hypothetical protein
VQRAVTLAVDHGTLVAPLAGDLPTLFHGERVAWATHPSQVVELLLEELRSARSSFLLSVPRDIDVDEHLVASVVDAARRCSSVTVLGGPALLSPLEALPVELGLLSLPGLLLCVDDRRLLGSRNLRMAAAMESALLSASLRSAVAPTVGAPPINKRPALMTADDSDEAQ